MSLKKFLFFLTEKDGRSRQIVNGVVTSLTQPKQLPQAPDGNQEISLGWERSPIYHGNVRKFGLPLGFVYDGYTILKNDFYKFNIDRELYLLVKKLTYTNTDTTFTEFYKQLYKGELDFSTFEDDQGDKRATINIMEGGLQKLLKANENTVYEIQMPDNLAMDGMYIVGRYRWFMTEYEQISEGFPGMFQLNNDSQIPGLALFDVQLTLTGTFEPITKDNTEYFAAATQDIAGVRITGLIENLNHNGAAGPLGHSLQIFNTVTDTTRMIIDLTPDDPYPEHYNLTIDQTIDLLEGDRVFYKANGAFTQGNLQLEAKSKPEQSVIPIVTIYELGQRLIEKITGSRDNFDSSFLQTVGIGFSSGDGIRSLPGAVLKTKWSDYWGFVNKVLCAEMTITDKIRISPRLNAYDNTKAAIPIGEVKGLKITKATDLMGTRVKVGHQEQRIDDTNGKYDFNGYMYFSLPIKRLADGEIDLQSPYKASPYEIEQTRANYEGKVTTDKAEDNDIYALAITPDAASNIFETTAVFSADGGELSGGQPLLSISAPLPLIRAGAKIRISGSASNDQDLTVKSAGSWFFGQLIIPDQTLVDEPLVNITIEILDGEYYSLDRSIAIDQLLAPPDDVDAEIKESIFNIPLSPKRILAANKSWLAGALYQYEGQSLVFTSANRNKELIAGGLIEKADVPVTSLGAPMFLPYYFEFDAVSPIDMPEDMETDPNPVYSFVWDGVLYKGFFINGGIALNDREEQTFKLLAHPDNDMTNLI